MAHPGDLIAKAAEIEALAEASTDTATRAELMSIARRFRLLALRAEAKGRDVPDIQQEIAELDRAQSAARPKQGD
jgi:hypothetical protein